MKTLYEKIRYKNNTKKVNLIFTSSAHKEDFLIYNDIKMKIKDFGLEYGIVEQGTGYHIPQGVLLINGQRSSTIFKGLKELDTKNVFHYILKLFQKN